MGTKLHLVGERFGRLIVIGELSERTKRGNVRWLCRCDCGTELEVAGGNLTSGNTKTCGCVSPSTTHGLSKTPEWNAWIYMKQRCLNPRSKCYRYYGGRGISVHPNWVDSFESFYAHIGRKPAPEYSLDRIDPDGNYEPGNVRWATPQQQLANRHVAGMTFDTFQHKARMSSPYLGNHADLASRLIEQANAVAQWAKAGSVGNESMSDSVLVAALGDILSCASELADRLEVSLDSVAANKLRHEKKQNALTATATATI